MDTPRVESIETIASTKWLSLQTISYTDQAGASRKWNMVTRATKSRDTADAVVIIPILRNISKSGSNGECGKPDTLLIEQFRPPIGRNTIEFPAGLIDDGETPSQAALRELQEETGYIGELSGVQLVSRNVCMSPGLTDESVNIALVEIDLNDPRNHGTPHPNLDEGEYVKTKRIPLMDGLRKVLEDGSESMPIMGLYMFAIGLELGTQYAL